MPLAFQIERLRTELARRVGPDFRILEVDLHGLDGAERDVAVDAVVAGTPSPFVLLDGRMVCSGEVAVSAILDALT